MDLLYKDTNITFFNMKENNKCILCVTALDDINESELDNISSILKTILETYKKQNIEWSILYDIRKGGVPTKRMIDYWVKIFRQLHPIMEHNQNATSILVQSVEISDILNKVILLWEPVGEVKFFTDYDSSIEYLKKKNMELKLPSITKIKLKGSKF